MHLIAQQNLPLLVLLLTCMEVSADIGGPGVFSEAGKQAVGKREQPAPHADGEQQQFQQQPPTQQEEQRDQFTQQTETPVQKEIKQQVENLQEDFQRQNSEVTREHLLEKELDRQELSEEAPTRESKDSPLGHKDKGETMTSGEDTFSSRSDAEAQDVKVEPDTSGSNEGVVGKVVDLAVEDDVGLQAPPSEHVPLSRLPPDQEAEQQLLQGQQQKEQLPGTSGAAVVPLEQQQSGGEGETSSDVDDGNVQKEEVKPPPTEEEIEGERLFQVGEKLINATYYREYEEAYQNFLKAAELNHQKAKEYVAFSYLFGDYLPQNVTKAAELFAELADKGSPKAQMGLSFMYSAGFHYNSSQAKALIYSTFGALGGDPLAQMSLGYRYYAGIGVESKCETALTYYRRVAMKVADSVTLSGGPVVQRIRLQEEVESQGTSNGPLLDDDLLQYYHFLADKGDQQAQIVLGTLYYQGGKGVQINHEQAYHYFSTAADSGSGHALGYLGKMHSEGSPVVKQSNHTAFEFFKRSADKNNHIGQTGLGMMYLNGLGVEKDIKKAFRYFSLASDQGSVDAQLQLGIMYYYGIGIEVRRDYKMAVKYFTMASQNGHVLAFYNLAQMHATGTGVLRNCHTAVELFKNVAERGRWSEMLVDAHRMYHEGSVDTALVKYMFLADLGYEVAQSNVAYMLDSGVTTKFDRHETHQRALLQYSRAASQGSTHARLKMGDYHYYGLGTDVDYESAASHYRMASEQQHNAQAMFNLGYMHEKGLGLKQDVHLAKRFYDMAAETSLDAHLPVTLALLKLGVFYGMDVFSKEFEGVSGILEAIDPVAYLGPEWDLYLATLLAFLLGIVFLMRRIR